jgi:hypothetical protein
VVRSGVQCQRLEAPSCVREDHRPNACIDNLPGTGRNCDAKWAVDRRQECGKGDRGWQFRVLAVRKFNWPAATVGASPQLNSHFVQAKVCGRRDSNPHPRRDRDLSPQASVRRRPLQSTRVFVLLDLVGACPSSSKSVRTGSWDLVSNWLAILQRVELRSSGATTLRTTSWSSSIGPAS